MQTAFVPTTHVDAGLFVLLQAAEQSREMSERNCGGAAGREKGIRPRGPSCCFQGNEITKFEPIFDVVDRCNLDWKLHESAFGNGYVEQSSDEPRFTPGCTGVSGHLRNDHGLVLRVLIKSWKFRELAWSPDDFVLAATCYADDVVLVAASVAAAEAMVAEVIAKLREVGLSVGAQITQWTSHPKIMDKSIVVDGLVVLWEKGSGMCWVEGVFGRKCKMRNCTQICSSQQVFGRSGDPF